MTVKPEHRHYLIGWGGALLVHAVVILGVFSLLIRPVQVTVKAGKNSTEVELTIELVPSVVASSALPRPVTQPTLQAIPALPKQPQIQPISKPEPSHETHSPTEHQTKPSNPAKGATDAKPDDLHNDPPVYPEESRIAREQGVVILRVEVTAAGEAANVSILQSSGCFRLDQAAKHAVQHWKFHPALMTGMPVSSEADVPVRFKLQ